MSTSLKAIDTNILLRYLLKDDLKQAEAARRFIQSCTVNDRIYVNLIVLNELVWVLKRIYGYSKLEIADTLEKMLQTEQLHMENNEAIYIALRHYRKYNVDFADAIIGAINQQPGYKTATFDKKTAALATFELLA